MNLSQFALMLLLFSVCGFAHSRTIAAVEEQNDIDNSIEIEEKSRAHPFEQDWLKFTKMPPTKLFQTYGSTVEIACEIMGSQVPTVQWIVGHLPLAEVDDLETNILSENAPTAIARVRSVHVIDHMLAEPRTYTCVGRTGLKTIYASTVVYPQTDVNDLSQIHEKPFPGPHKPRIVYSEKIHLDLIGSNVLLPCKVHSHPQSEVFWMNNEGKMIDQSQRFRILPTGDLLISNIKWEDMGGYKCIARNSVGKDIADTFVYPVLKEDNE